MALKSHWNRPDDIDDASFVVDVEISIDPSGKVVGSRVVKPCGNTRWDNSVKTAVAATKAISRPPPKGFPGTIVARFDVGTEGDNVMQLSSQ